MCKHHLLAAFSVALCATAFAGDESGDSPQAQSLRNAESDGAAIALAVYCATPKATIALYAQALLSQSKQFSMKNSIDFSDASYRELAKSSFNQTMGFMSSLTPTPENKRENCADVNKKISEALAINDLSLQADKQAEPN